jgi:hypothetical protein
MKIATDPLGFPLKLTIKVGDFERDGRHITYETVAGFVVADCEHRIEIKRGLSSERLCEVASHEAYHLFYSVRHLITTDEETQCVVFGQLVNRIFKAAS